MPTQVRLPDGRIVRDVKPIPRPKFGELTNGSEVMVSIYEIGGWFERACTVLEITSAKQLVVSYEEIRWPREGEEPDEGKTYKIGQRLARIKVSDILCWMKDWPDHLKVIQGDLYWGGKIVGLAPKNIADQLTLKV